MEKVLPEDAYEVTRNADTERPLQENIGITGRQELIIVRHGKTISGSGANFQAIVAGQVSLNKTIKTVWYIK
jgi:hypothetical protein